MKVIDLLNKIANNEEVPKKIKHDSSTYEVPREIIWLLEAQDKLSFLNDEIEIIEEKPKKIETFNLMYPISKEYNSEIGALVSIYNSILAKINVNVQDLIKAVNYLLEKESDK